MSRAGLLWSLWLECEEERSQLTAVHKLGLVFISFLHPGRPRVCLTGASCFSPPSPAESTQERNWPSSWGASGETGGSWGSSGPTRQPSLCTGRGLWSPQWRPSCPTSWPWARPGSELTQCLRPPNSGEAVTESVHYDEVLVAPVAEVIRTNLFKWICWAR